MNSISFTLWFLMPFRSESDEEFFPVNLTFISWVKHFGNGLDFMAFCWCFCKVEGNRYMKAQKASTKLLLDLIISSTKTSFGINPFCFLSIFFKNSTTRDRL